MNPLLSIIIPCYNHGKYIEEALASIKKYDGEAVPYEIIIVNDGSTDLFTIDILARLSSEGYTVINQVNQGLGATRNNGIRLAKGKYILPLDSDNKVCKPYLTEAVELLEQDESITVVYSDIQCFGGRINLWLGGEYNMQKLMLHNYIDACAVYRKSLWEELGGYDEKMPFMGYEDWEFWLRTSFAAHRFYYLQVIGFEYRVLDDSMINSLSAQKYDAILKYVETKHSSRLGSEYIRQKYMAAFKQKKMALVKVCLAVWTPGLLRWFKKMGWIKSEQVL